MLQLPPGTHWVKQATTANEQKSGYAQDVLDTGDMYGIMDTMKLCHVARKGKLLYVMKKYYIYETT
jgi:hypothetical protein